MVEIVQGTFSENADLFEAAFESATETYTTETLQYSEHRYSIPVTLTLTSQANSDLTAEYSTNLVITKEVITELADSLLTPELSVPPVEEIEVEFTGADVLMSVSLGVSNIPAEASFFLLETEFSASGKDVLGT